MKTVGNYSLKYTFPTSFIFVLFLSVSSWAQSKVYTYHSLGIAHIQFQEDLNLEKNISRETDFATYRGTVIQLQKQSSIQGLGYSMGGIIGTGRAVAAGSGETLVYTGGSNWFLVGITPKIYYRLTKPISFGIQSLAFYKNITFPDNNAIQAKAKQKLSFAILGDLTIQLNQDIEFVQSVGSMNGDSTLWKIGMNYTY